MLILSALAILAALIFAGWVISGVLERVIVEGLDRRLDAEIALLASTVDATGKVDHDRLAQRTGAFEQGPGWRWRIDGPGASIGSADFPSLDSPPHPHRPDQGRIGDERRGDGPSGPRDIGDRSGGIDPLDGRAADGERVHARRLTIRTRGGAVTFTTAAPREVVSRPIRAALAPLLVALVTLGALLWVATIVQLRLGLRPLRRMRDQVAAMRSGLVSHLDEDQPSELKPLAIELNALARDNVAALDTARQSAANLAHALKTPVATLALDLRDEPARAVQVARINATIRHHLGRARAATANGRVSTPLQPVVDDIIAAVRLLHAERAIAFDVAVGDIRVAVDRHDLDELIGNLIDNAARHARTRVEVRAVSATNDRHQVLVTVADDGDGIAAEARERVTHPGVRLDERGDGHGFGLNIVEELVTLYGGSLTLDDAAIRGLLVRLVLPEGA